MILFLDFDGVLHPDAVYFYRSRGVVLEVAHLPIQYAGHELFCYAPALESVLADFPEVNIVLSTSWVPALGFSRTCERLPALLRERVIGATFHSRMTPYWHRQSRFEQIFEHVNHRRLGPGWLAIDNDAAGWPTSQKCYLIHTDDNRGIGDPATLATLRNKLKDMQP